VELEDFNLKHARGPMTEERLVLAELEKAGDGDFLRAVAEAVLQLLMESDVEGMIGAGRYERSGERTTWRNGYRDRTLDTRVGALGTEALSGSSSGRRSPTRRAKVPPDWAACAS
jgi:putative transposase